MADRRIAAHRISLRPRSDPDSNQVFTTLTIAAAGYGRRGINPGPECHAKAAADFNGDGKADILWQNDDGTPDIWLMDGLNQIGAGVVGPGNPGPTWHIKDAADFNGDGKADILWQNDDGTPDIWLMDGLNQIGAGVVGPANPGPTWHVIA